MQYITRLGMSQSQKPWSPPPPPRNYYMMYPLDARVRTIKISPVHKILLTGTWTECTAQGPCEHLYIHLLISVCPKKPFKVTYKEMKIFENACPQYEVLQILGMLFISNTHGADPLPPSSTCSEDR
jgi:hypothetical protein